MSFRSSLEKNQYGHINWAWDLLTFPAVFDTEIRVSRTACLAAFNGHSVGGKSTRAKGSNTRSFGVTAIVDIVCNRWDNAWARWGGRSAGGGYGASG